MAGRAQTQERNREALLASAIDMIASHGYRAATVEAVASRAGLTTGAVYSAFGGKRELFYAALVQCRDRLLPRVDLDLPADRPATDVLARFGRELATAAAEPDSRRLYQLVVELTALALHDPLFADRLRADSDPFAEGLAAALTGRAAPAGGTLDKAAAQRVAAAASALTRGLVQRWIWLDDPVDAALMEESCRALAGLRHTTGTDDDTNTETDIDTVSSS